MGWTQSMNGSKQGTQHFLYKENTHINMHTKPGGGRLMGTGHDSSLVSSFLSSSPLSAAGARGPHTGILQDSQALLALLLGPGPLKHQPQQAL